jgi:branched-chain amino acid transport system substrate-binding protein
MISGQVKLRKLCLGLFISSVVLIVLITPSASQSAESSKMIKIGIPGPMKFMPGEHLWRGATLAADEINKAGGIGGRKIELVKADTNEMLSVSDAGSAYEKLITVDKVDFLVGGFRSDVVLAVQEQIASHRIIFIGAGGAGHPSLNERVAKDYDKYKYWFRLSTLNTVLLGHAQFGLLDTAATAVRKELGVKAPRVALLCEKGLHFDGIVQDAQEKFPQMGMKIVGTWRFSPTATDVTAELTGIRAARPHLTYHMSTGPVGVVLSRQWGELEIPAALAGSNVEAMSKRHWAATGGMCNYELVENAYGRVHMTDKTIPFVDKYLKEFNEHPAHASASYDAIYVLKDAIERAGTMETNAVIAALEKTDYQAAIGRVAFFPRGHKWPHDVIWKPGYRTSVGIQWRDGNLTVVWPDGRPVLGDKAWVGTRYRGTVDYQLPPWVMKYWKGKEVE